MSLSLEHSRHCPEMVQAVRTKPDVPQDKTAFLYCNYTGGTAQNHRATKHPKRKETARGFCFCEEK